MIILQTEISNIFPSSVEQSSVLKTISVNFSGQTVTYILNK